MKHGANVNAFYKGPEKSVSPVPLIEDEVVLPIELPAEYITDTAESTTEFPINEDLPKESWKTKKKRIPYGLKEEPKPEVSDAYST